MLIALLSESVDFPELEEGKALRVGEVTQLAKCKLCRHELDCQKPCGNAGCGGMGYNPSPRRRRQGGPRVGAGLVDNEIHIKEVPGVSQGDLHMYAHMCTHTHTLTCSCTHTCII